MGRLIDADLLKDNIIKCLKPLDPEEEMIDVDVALVSTLMEIDNQPTAFDVNKVVKQLDKASDYYEFDEQGKENVQMINLTKAIEIIKGGEVDGEINGKIY